MHLRPETLTDLAVIIVHYHTPSLAAEAVSALRAECDRAGLRADCVIVDNGSDAAGAALLGGLGVTVLTTDRNLGYAGAVNLGVARTQAPLIVAMNPDVVVQDGCLAALCRALRDGGAAAAGPRFSWDQEGRLLLPPTERRDLASEALARLSVRGPRWARLARQRWRRHAHRHWLARDSVTSFALSGALLAMRRDAWEQVGPFDEGFQLYFEETDWLTRLARRGWQAHYVPTARAVHRYNSSARREPATAAWFEASARRFEAKHLGRAASWLRRLEHWPRRTHEPTESQPAAVAAPSIEIAGASGWIECSSTAAGYPAAAVPSIEPPGASGWIERSSAAGCRAAADVPPSIEVACASGGWIECSAAAAGYPAAAARIEARALQQEQQNARDQRSQGQNAAHRWQLPPDVWDHLAPGRYTLRLIDDAGCERATAAFVREAFAREASGR